MDQKDDRQRFLLHITPASTRVSTTAIIQVFVEMEGRPSVSNAIYALVK